MAEEARRSIDEIIGSIRSIMEPGRAVANDDGAGDLTDLPPHSPPPSSLAEPVAPRMTAPRAPVPRTATIDAAPAAPDASDAVRMAQIAETVNRNLADAAPVAVAIDDKPFIEDVPIFEPPARAPEPVRAVEIDDDAIVASFGRRTAAPRVDERPAKRPEPRPTQDRPMHDRFTAIGEVVEEAVTARGVVRAANDAAPSAAPSAAPAPPPTAAPQVAPQAAPSIAASMTPANLPATQPPAHVPPQAHVPPRGRPAQAGQATDPILDDATLRPIVREWLDDNLPPLVERLVREELQKAIHGGRRGR